MRHDSAQSCQIKRVKRRRKKMHTTPSPTTPIMGWDCQKEEEKCSQLLSADVRAFII